jgi:broad specificity polyphosphatase/5'/3'-nucleotidase SurE
MPKNSIAEITYSSTTGATAAQFVPGGPSIIATAATFAATTTLVFEISLDGGTTYVTLSDVNRDVITSTVDDATADQYWHVNLPRGGCLIRANCTAGTMTSGGSWIAQASSDV